MSKFQPRTLRSAGLVGLVCLAAAACSPQPGEFGDSFFPHGKWEQIPPSADNMVEVVTLQHLVRFQSGQAALDSDQRGRLDEFIRANHLRNSDEIVLEAAGADSLAAGRMVAIRHEFASYGLLATDAETAASGAGEVVVNVTRAVVIPPDCSVPQPEPTLRPNNKWGCSVNSALGMMVADPLDLVEGRDLGPGDGEQASGALRRYRADEIKELNEEATNN